MIEFNIKRQLTVFEWLQMPLAVRQLFIKWFNIKRTGGAIVEGSRVVSDGHTIEDLSVVSLKSLQVFLHTEDDHWDKLLHLTINKMENYIDGNQNEPLVTATESSGLVSPAVSKRRGRPPFKKTVEGNTLANA